jgi:GNAT superfamily N-acetyltransferase
MSQNSTNGVKKIFSTLLVVGLLVPFAFSFAHEEPLPEAPAGEAPASDGSSAGEVSSSLETEAPAPGEAPSKVDEVRPLPASTTLPLISQPPMPPKPKLATTTVTPVIEEPPLPRPDMVTSSYDELFSTGTILFATLGGFLFLVLAASLALKTKKKGSENKEDPCGHIKEQLEHMKLELKKTEGEFNLQEALFQKLKEKLQENIEKKKAELIGAAKEKAKDFALGEKEGTLARKTVDTLEEVRETYDDLQEKFNQAKKLLESLRAKKDGYTQEVKALELSYRACVAGTAVSGVSTFSGVKRKLPQINTSGIVIRNAETEDVEGMQDVFYKGWLSVYPNKEVGITEDDIEDRFKDRLAPERLEKRRERIKNMPPAEKELVVVDGKKVVGVCRLIKHQDHNQLKAIYLLPEYQTRGIGQMIWTETQKFFDPTKNTRVEVATYNQKAIDFYSKLGFVDTGRRMSDENFKMKSGAMIPEMEMVLKVK